MSGETFSLVKCSECGLVITSPRPDVADLERYYHFPNYISHSSTSAGITDTLYFLARNFTVAWKYKIATHLIKNPRLLDYGCGTGDFLSYCKRKGLPIAGLEPASNARSAAENKTGINIAHDIAQLRQDKFDIITMWHVLEHIPDLSFTITTLASMLNESGRLIIAVPNYQSRDAETYREYWAGYDVPRHLWHFSKESIGKLLESHALRLVGIRPMKLDSFYVSLLSEKYKAGNQSAATFLRAFFSGVASNFAAARTKNHSSLIYIAAK